MNAAVLSRQEIARQRVAVIRNALEVANEELVKAYEARDWEALDYADFPAYCATELPELRFIKLRVEVRRERAQALRDQGATIPEIVAATGSSLGTIHRDLNPAPSFQMETAPKPKPCTMAAVLALVAASNGITANEMAAKYGWNHGQVSGALSKLDRKKKAIQRTGVFREGYGVYVVTVSK